MGRGERRGDVSNEPPDWTYKSPEELWNAGIRPVNASPPQPIIHEVTGCDDCPLYQRSAERGLGYCPVSKYVGPLRRDGTGYKCPLRSRPLLVRLRESEEK
jgi:hypothetical protein